jgi:hypothetical protein
VVKTPVNPKRVSAFLEIAKKGFNSQFWEGQKEF